MCKQSEQDDLFEELIEALELAVGYAEHQATILVPPHSRHAESLAGHFKALLEKTGQRQRGVSKCFTAALDAVRNMGKLEVVK